MLESKCNHWVHEMVTGFMKELGKEGDDKKLMKHLETRNALLKTMIQEQDMDLSEWLEAEITRQLKHRNEVVPLRRMEKYSFNDQMQDSNPDALHT